MHSRRSFGRVAKTVGITSALTLGLLMATASSGADEPPHPSPNCPAGSTALDCTLTVAWGPNSEATSILPFDSAPNYTQVNINDFQQLMFRPLYWFGKGVSTGVQYPLSPANAPVFTTTAGGDTMVKIVTKDWKFRSGNASSSPSESVAARSIRFWLNLDKAEGLARYGRFDPNYGIPSQVTNVVVGPANTIKITFNTKLNTTWLLDNYLSEIVPLPIAWDKTSASGGAEGCSTAGWNSTGANGLDAKCDLVWDFVNGQNNDPASYSTNALWQWVDGPYRLHSFPMSAGAPTGDDILYANSNYSGPDTSRVGRIVYSSFPSLNAELVALEAGLLDIGYSTPSDVSNAPTPCSGGVNLVSNLNGNYSVKTACTRAFNGAIFNFDGSSPGGAEIAQQYIREALQYGLDQPLIVDAVDRGYASPTYSPLPEGEALPGPSTYPFNLDAGKNLLLANGWADQDNVQSCVSPGTAAGDCGAGISNGSTMKFNYYYPSGNQMLTTQVAAEVQEWHNEGIAVTTHAEPPGSLAADCAVGGNVWDICQELGSYEDDGYSYEPNYWVYSPDYYPSDELLYHMGDPGGFNSAELQTLVKGTTLGATLYSPTSNQSPYGTSDARYQAVHLPFLYLPTTNPVVELKNTVNGALAQNPLDDFMPQYDYL